MKKMLSCVAALACAAAAADDGLMMPADARLDFAEDGALLVNGKPRFLIGNLYYAHYGRGELARGPGYPEEHAWIYESMPTRDYLQRLGFDTSGGEVSSTWLGKYREPRRFYQARNAVEWDVATNYWHSGLPMVVDFTCATWSHGGMKHVEGKKPEARAFARDCHFMYYSLVTDEGRELWRDMWRSGAEELKAHGARPYVYELFNEPNYDDRSPEAREQFALFLSRRWGGDLSAMNAAWHSSYGTFAEAAAFREPRECAAQGVEWMKFREECFISGIRLGIETIREVDPSARFCFQPLSHMQCLVPVLGAYSLCEVSMMPTGGGSLYQDTVIRALSDGKPMIDGETYLGRTRASHRCKLILEWARGLNASYYFKWERRMREIDKADPEGSLMRQGKRFPWLGLNPAVVPPQALAGIMDAKRDIFAMQDLFGSRDRGIAPESRAATLFSLPTMRLAYVAGHRCGAFAETAADALAVDAHVPVDAVFEEQLPDGRLDRFRFLVASGIEATLSRTPGIIRKWVEAGGSLVLLEEAMGLDEIANPRKSAASDFPGIRLGGEVKGGSSNFAFRGADYEAVPYRETEFAPGAGWETVASLPSGHPAVSRRRIGKGVVHYVGVRFTSRGEEGRFLASLASASGVGATCRTLDYLTDAPVDGIEVHAARLPNGDTGFAVVNTALAPKAVKFIPGDGFRAESLVDVSRKVCLGKGKDGAVLLLLGPSDPVVLRGGVEGGLAVEPYERALSGVPEFIASHKSGDVLPWFSVDAGRIRFVDIRGQANAELGKIVKNPPWGPTDCAGIPFDFIRPDQNGGRSCVLLEAGKSVRGIPVNASAASLCFLHAGIGARGGDAIKYVVRYSDGSSLDVAARKGSGFGDVDVSLPAVLPESFGCCPGWADDARRGLWAFRWENPWPEKAVSSLDIVADGWFSAVVAGVSAETRGARSGLARPSGARRAIDLAKAAAMGTEGAKAVWRDGGLELAVADNTKHWSGLNLKLGEPIPAGELKGELVVEVNSGRTPLGKAGKGGQRLRASGVFRMAGGKETRHWFDESQRVVQGGRIDEDPWTWQTVRFGLKGAAPEGAEAMKTLVFSLSDMPQEGRSGLVFRNLRLE